MPMFAPMSSATSPGVTTRRIASCSGCSRGAWVQGSPCRRYCACPERRSTKRGGQSWMRIGTDHKVLRWRVTTAVRRVRPRSWVRRYQRRSRASSGWRAVTCALISLHEVRSRHRVQAIGADGSGQLRWLHRPVGALDEPVRSRVEGNERPEHVDRPLLEDAVKPMAQLVAKVFHRGAVAIRAKVPLQRLGGLGARVVPVLGHIGTEVGVETRLFPAPVKDRPHEIADEEVVEQPVADGGHQRLAWNLEAQTPSEPARLEVDHVILAADADVDEVEERAEMENGLKVRVDLAMVLRGEALTPIVPELLRSQGDLGPCRGGDLGDRVLQAIVADESREDFVPLRLEPRRVVRELRGVHSRPRTVLSLISVHRAERNEVAGPEVPHPMCDTGAQRALDRRVRPQTPALLVEEIDHVRVAETFEGEEDRERVASDDALDVPPPPIVAGIVEVQQEPAPHVDQQHGILVVVGDAQDADAA